MSKNSNRHFQRKFSYFGEDATGGGHTVVMYGDSTGYYAKWGSSDNKFEIVGSASQTGDFDLNGNLTVAETITGSSNATVAGTLGVTKTITASSALIIPLQTGSSSSLNLPNFGISVVGATSSGVRMHVLAAPVAGVIKAITCVDLATTATDYAKVWTGSTNVFFGTSDNQISYGDINLSSLLIGISATQWGIIANGGTLGTYTT